MSLNWASSDIVSFLSDLQGVLMRGTPLEAVSGRLRGTQVVIGRRDDAVVTAAISHYQFEALHPSRDVNANAVPSGATVRVA